MSYTMSLIDDGKGLLRVGAGRVTGADLLEGVNAGRSDASILKETSYALVDFTDVSEFDVSTDSIQALANIRFQMAKTIPKRYTAIVAPKAVVYGMARMFQMFDSVPGWTVELFRSRADADRWLDEVVPGRSRRDLEP